MNMALYPDPNKNPSWAQMFVIENEHAHQIATAKNPQVEPRLLSKIIDIIKKHSPYVKAYVMMDEECQKQSQIAHARGIEPPEVKLLFTKNTKLDKNVYNLPLIGNDVAVVYVPNAEDDPPQAYITIHPRRESVRILGLYILNIFLIIIFI